MASVLALGVVWNRDVGARGRSEGYCPTFKKCAGGNFVFYQLTNPSPCFSMKPKNNNNKIKNKEIVILIKDIRVCYETKSPLLI